MADAEACKAEASPGEAPAAAVGAAAATEAEPDKREVYLVVEVISDRAARMLVACQWLAQMLALGLLVYCTYLKFSRTPSWFFQSHTVRRVSMAFGAVWLPLILGVVAFFLKRAVVAHRAKATWTHRRRVLCSLAAAQLAVVLMNVGVWLGVSVYTAWGCPSLATRHAAITASFISASSWNALLLLSLIGAHNLLPAELVCMASAKRKAGLLPVVDTPSLTAGRDMASRGALVLDLPWAVHLPKLLLLWLPDQVVIVLMLLYGLGYVGPSNCQPGAFCGSIKIISAVGPCSQWVYACVAERWFTVLSVATASLFLVQMIIFLALVWLGIREYRRRSYAEYRLANLLLRLLLHTRLPAATILALSIILLWFLMNGSCATWSLTQNMMSAQVVMASLAALDAILYMPASEGQGKPSARFELAWTEEEAAEMRLERGEPERRLFCFELALKLLYFSWSVYYLEEEPMPGVSIETALGLFGLEEHWMAWEKEPTDTKCLVAWGVRAKTIVISFRGTASLKNALTNIQAWQVRLSGNEASGRGPLVHAGFLAALQANGLGQRIISRVKGIIAEAGGGAGWQVFLTGHSLGGALAALAALDMTRAFKGMGAAAPRVCCYTYGAPRTGGRAFAREFNRRVEGYRIVNSDDIVPKTGKLLFLFKHCGKQVIVNGTGNLILWPGYLEHSVHQVATSVSVVEHLLLSYQQSFNAVMRAQFDLRMSEGGSERLRQLWDCKYVQCMLTETMGMRQESLQQLLVSPKEGSSRGAAAAQELLETSSDLNVTG